MRILLIVLALFVPAAAHAQLLQMTNEQFVASITPAVNQACANAAATQTIVQSSSPISTVPKVASLLPYVTASCADANAIAALLAKADSNTYRWLYSLNSFMLSDLSDALGPH
jgi:hypothetical protein